MTIERRAQLNSGTILDDRYVIRDVLGEGGFGRTYAAENLLNGERAAVKEYLADDQDRFLKEARTLRDFGENEGIVRVLDYFEEDGRAYLVMELLKGETLKRYVSVNGRMPAENIFRKMPRLLKALAAIHRAGVIHRDISPENVMLSPEGELTLLDFGAAREMKDGATHSIIYKDGYAPKEQMDRKGQLGPWTDLYSLCATAYYSITGQTPEDAIGRVLHDELKKPSELGIEIDPAAERMLMKGLSLRPEKRWQSAEELLGELVKVYPERDPVKEAAEKKRKRRICFAFAALMAVLISFGILYYRKNSARIRLRHIPTEHFYMKREDLSDEEYRKAAEEFRIRAEAYAGAGNYLIEEDEEKLTLTFPRSFFDEETPMEVLNTYLLTETEDGSFEPEGFSFFSDWVVDWENPESSLFRGEYQRSETQITGETYLARYALPDEGRAGTMSTMLVMKDRLDAAELPYAFGLSHYSDTEIVIKVPQEGCGGIYLATLGYFNNGYLVAENGMEYMYVNDTAEVSFTSSDAGEKEERTVRPKLEIIESGDAWALRINFNHYASDEILEKIQSRLAAGESEMIYTIAAGNYPVLSGDLKEAQETLKEGYVLLERKLIGTEQDLTGENAALGRYLITFFEEEPQAKKMDVTAVRKLGADGTPVLESISSAEELPETHTEYMASKLRVDMDEIRVRHREFTGRDDPGGGWVLASYGTSMQFLLEDYPADDFPENALAEIREMMQDLPWPGEGIKSVHFYVRSDASTGGDPVNLIAFSESEKSGLYYDFIGMNLSEEERARAQAFLEDDPWYTERTGPFSG